MRLIVALQTAQEVEIGMAEVVSGSRTSRHPALVLGQTELPSYRSESTIVSVVASRSLAFCAIACSVMARLLRRR
jgi:hypothetical protein